MRKHVSELFDAMRLVFAVLGFVMMGQGIAVAEFDDLFVFGDSLSDVGNLDRVTLGLQPGDDYFDGRFSNGPVYSELLALELGLGPLERSTADGNNFAYGGGRTSGTSFFEGGLLIQDLDDQVDQFLEERTVSSNALHVVFAGANDFILGGQNNPGVPVQRIRNQFDRLVDAGATQFLSINLPLLGTTPRFNDSPDTMNQLSRQFNDELSVELEELAMTPGVTVHALDLEGLMTNVIALPEAFGFTNVTEVGMSAGDADGFLFWDDVHPTTDAHAMIAAAAFALFDPEYVANDFNFNGELDAADIDIIAHRLAQGSFDASYDLDMDGVLDVGDIEAVLAAAETRNGDSNLDGEVDFTDFLAIARNFNATGEDLRWSDGDFDANGRVELTDFLILSRNFGEAGTVRAVPEVCSGGMVVGVLLVLGQRRSRRRCGLGGSEWARGGADSYAELIRTARSRLKAGLRTGRDYKLG